MQFNKNIMIYIRTFIWYLLF